MTREAPLRSDPDAPPAPARPGEGLSAAPERILVLVAADARAAHLVREGRRLSDLLGGAPWTAAHVERPGAAPPSPASTQALREALKLAEQAGASTVTLTGDDLAGAVLDYARRNRITRIVVAAPRRRRLRFRRGLVQALSEGADGASLHVVTAPAEAPVSGPAARPAPGRHAWQGHLVALAAVAVATVAAFSLDRYVASANLAMVYLLSVLVAGLASGFWPAVSAAAASALAYNFLFLAPRLTFTIGHAGDVFTFAVFFAVAMATGWLSGRVRDQARAAAERAAGISAVLSATRRLSAAARAQDAATALAEQLGAATGAAAVVLTPVDGVLRLAAASPPLDALAPGDMAAARRAWETGDAAGAATAHAGWTFRPLQGVWARAGVVGVAQAAIATDEGERYVAALLDQGAVALERAEFAADAADAEALRRTDRLRSALLNSVSHDLRTPLSTVLGSVTTLIDYGKSLSAKVREDLLLSIREEAERLNRYVGDLLDMTRIEGGALVTRREWTDVRDVLRAAVERVRRRLGSRRIDWDFPRQVTMVMADPSLLEQALVNVLENAVAYSPDGATIEVAAYEDRRNVVLSIEDEGRGIPPADLERVFERFRRMDEATDRGKGAGLGLAIAKGFVEAMGGRIAAASPIHDGHGTRILISLPKARETPEDLL